MNETNPYASPVAECRKMSSRSEFREAVLWAALFFESVFAMGASEKIIVAAAFCGVAMCAVVMVWGIGDRIDQRNEQGQE